MQILQVPYGTNIIEFTILQDSALQDSSRLFLSLQNWDTAVVAMETFSSESSLS